MDYSKLSDLDINKMVANSLNLSIFSECDNWISVIKVSDNACRTGKFDPCNNPSDAWPIIVENKISIYCYMDERDESLYEWEALSFDELNKTKGEFSGHPENPLRAAMIVYLMMNEDK